MFPIDSTVTIVLSYFGLAFILFIMIGLVWFVLSDTGSELMNFLFPNKLYQDPYKVYVPPVKPEPYGEINEPIALGPIEYPTSTYPTPTYPTSTYPTPTPTYKKWTPPTYEKRINLESFNVSTGKKTEVFVAEKAIKLPFVDGDSSFSENQTDTEPVKLVRSGTGYRVYGHPTVENGKWLSCRV